MDLCDVDIKGCGAIGFTAVTGTGAGIGGKRAWGRSQTRQRWLCMARKQWRGGERRVGEREERGEVGRRASSDSAA